MATDDDGDEQDEAGLFRRLMAGITPFDPPEQAPPPQRKPPARARFARADERAALSESIDVDASDIDDMEISSGEYLQFQRPSISRRQMRRLARGSFALQDEIDLHGMTIGEARAALQAFVDASVARGRTCVRIVHGKGLGSGARGPVLKRKVNGWLRKWDAVLAFTSARQVDGGTGALYVLLRRPPDQSR